MRRIETPAEEIEGVESKEKVSVSFDDLDALKEVIEKDLKKSFDENFFANTIIRSVNKRDSMAKDVGFSTSLAVMTTCGMVISFFDSSWKGMLLYSAVAAFFSLTALRHRRKLKRQKESTEIMVNNLAKMLQLSTEAMMSKKDS
jgi:hypothetical protein